MTCDIKTEDYVVFEREYGRVYRIKTVKGYITYVSPSDPIKYQDKDESNNNQLFRIVTMANGSV